MSHRVIYESTVMNLLYTYYNTDYYEYNIYLPEYPIPFIYTVQ